MMDNPNVNAILDAVIRAEREAAENKLFLDAKRLARR